MTFSLKGYLGLRGKFPKGPPSPQNKNKTKQRNKDTKTKLFSTLKNELSENCLSKGNISKKSKEFVIPLH